MGYRRVFTLIASYYFATRMRTPVLQRSHIDMHANSHMFTFTRERNDSNAERRKFSVTV